MNLDELRSVQDAERRNSGLQHLRDSFYEEAGRYIADLKAERQRVAERADDPFSSPEVGRLTDEIETAEEVVEAIYERRMGKLLQDASLAAADMGADEDGLTTEERELFHAVVDRIRANKTRVLDTVAGEDDGSDPGDGSGGSAGDPGSPGTDRRGTRRESDRRQSDSGTDRRETGSDSGEAGTSNRREVDPGSPPPDGGRRDSTAGSGGVPDREDPVEPDPDEGLPAAGAMGGESADDAPRSDRPEASPEPDGGTATERSGEPAPEPPSPDEFVGDATGDSEGTADGVPSMVAIDERVTVRITDDVGAIYGVDDREYDLERETVVDLPEQNARPLIDRGAAERLD